MEPCRSAGQITLENATGPEVVAAADRCIAQGGDRVLGLTIRAFGHIKAGAYPAAIADTDAALALKPDHADAMYYRGYAHEELGRLEEAERDYARAVDMGLKPILSVPARGRLRFLNNDFAGAYEDYSTWIELDPLNEAAHRSRGSAAAVLERFAQAERDFTHAIELSGNPKSYSGRAYVYYFTGRYREAVADYKKSLEGAPEGLKAAFLYLAMRRANDPDAMAELARQAAPLDRNSNPGVFPYLFLGKVGIDEMVDISIRTGIHKPRENESEGYFYAGMAELFAGNREKAKAWFQKTLATGVIRFDEIRGARKELRALGIRVPSPDPAIPAS